MAATRAISFSALVLTFVLWLTHLLKLINFPAGFSKEQSTGTSAKEADLTSLLNLANAPVFAVDHDGLITEWNQPLERISGLKKNEVLGKRLLNHFISEDSRNPLQTVIKDAKHGKETQSFLFSMSVPGKDPIELILSSSTRWDEYGKAIGVLGVSQNVTNMRKQERMLIRSHKIESIGLLTGGIAHDFNNLLTIIQGKLELLKERYQAEPDDTTEMLEDAHAAAINGAALTSLLMAFASQRVLVAQETEINDLINKSIRMSARILCEGITITSALSSEEIVAHVDPNLIESVLLNLFINARDAMDGNGHLLISTTIETLNTAQTEAKELLPGKYIVISIQDNGRGIPANDIDKVIEPFYSTKPMEQDSGLGLSMAHGSVRQSKGTLEIYSTIGKGTTVKVLFPLQGESGYDLVKLVKTEYPNIAIHLATGLADDQILEIDNRQYLEDIIRIYKPYSKNDLEESLNTLYTE